MVSAPVITLVPSASHPEVKCLSLSGRIDTSTVNSITPAVLQAVSDSPSGLIVDLHEVSFVSSAGLRLFLTAFKNAQSSNKKMALIRLHPEVYKIFKVAGLDPMLGIFKDEKQALDEVWRKA